MRFATATLVFAAIAALAGVFTGWLGHGLDPLSAWLSLALGLAAGLAAWKSCPPATRIPFTLGERILLVVFALFALRSFFWAIFPDNNELKVLSPNNLGDMSLHLTYINYLANGAPIWPVNPIFAAGPLEYPVGIDLLNSLLKLIGVDPIRGIIWVGLIGSLLTALALRRWGRAFALAGFLANGGLAGFALIAELIHTGQFHLEDFQSELAWKSIPLALFVTQRCLLYAIPAGLLLLISWRARYFKKEGESPKWQLPLWIEWLLYSTLPLFHVHTFLALSFLLGAWVFFLPAPHRWKLVRFITASVLPATGLVALVTGGFASHSIIHWKIGWMQGDDNFLHFWLRNFGVLPLFVLMLIGLLIARRDRQRLAFVIPACLLFLLCCLVVFAVWDWDNTKLMIWSYLIVLPFLWETVIAEQPLWLRAPICTVLFFSGFASLAGGLDASHDGYRIALRSQLDSLAEPLATIPISSTFAAFPTYNHPLLLMGRKVVEGYPGHLSSYGIPYQATDEKLDKLMNGSPDWQELAHELGVNYLFWGPMESEAYPNSTQPWVNSAQLIAADQGWRIFQLTPPPK